MQQFKVPRWVRRIMRKGYYDGGDRNVIYYDGRWMGSSYPPETVYQAFRISYVVDRLNAVLAAQREEEER